MSEKLEAEYKTVQANLKEVGDQLKAYAETSQKEVARLGAMSGETKAAVDKLLITQGELQARLNAAEQLVAKIESGAGVHVSQKSVGQMVIESDAFKAFDIRGKGRVTVDVNAAVTSASGIVEPQRVAGIQAAPQRRMTIRDLCANGRTTSNSVEFVRETGFTNNAAPVSENPASNKPESDLTFDLLSAPVATIAHWIHASKQVLSDVQMLASYIDGRLRYGLMLKEEQQLLLGSGVGLNINGIYTQATSYSNPGVTITGETSIDRLRVAMLQAELAEYACDGIVLNPIDWAEIELTKTSDLAYLFASPTVMTGPMLWGKPVVSTQALTAGQFLVGAFKLGAQVWDREDASVMVSTEDRDNFVKNMVTILAEERLALTVYRTEAFVKGALV